MNNSSHKSISIMQSMAFILAIFLGAFPLVACSKAVDTGLVETHDFQELSQLMRKKNLPLLLEFNAEYCSYCRQLEEDFLGPMNNDSAYSNKVIIRQLSLDSSESIIDFQGKEVSASVFANRYQAFMTPTMIFIDADGKEVAEKIVGINTPSLFVAYIDAEIEKALNNVRAKNSLAKRKVLQVKPSH